MCSPIGHNSTKHFLCPIRSRHPLEFLEMVRWEAVPRGSFARNKNFRPAFSPDPTDCPWVSEDGLVPALVIFQYNHHHYHHYPSHPSCITALVGQETVRKQQRGTSCHTVHASEIWISQLEVRNSLKLSCLLRFCFVFHNLWDVIHSVELRGSQKTFHRVS